MPCTCAVNVPHDSRHTLLLGDRGHTVAPLVSWQVGTAEAHCHLGALAAAAADAAATQQHYATAADAYAVAVAQPHALGLFAQRCDVRCVGRCTTQWARCCTPALTEQSDEGGQQTKGWQGPL